MRGNLNLTSRGLVGWDGPWGWCSLISQVGCLNALGRAVEGFLGLSFGWGWIGREEKE